MAAGEPAESTNVCITQDEVAGWVGSSREAAARSLALLRELGAIETGRGRIIILDPQVLEKMARGESILT